MNEASQERYRIAQRIAEVYACNSHVAAVIVGGSTARGHADHYSDLDMGVIWEQAPSDFERRQVVQEANAELHRLYPFDPEEQVWSDDYFVHCNRADGIASKLLVEVGHYKRDFVEDLLNSVLNEYATNILWHNLISGIVDGIPLHGNVLTETWRDRAVNYPRKLSVAIVQKYGVIDHFWRWQMYLKRGNNLMDFYGAFQNAHHRILHVLLGLNRKYYFGFKWLTIIEQRLLIKPQNLLGRMQSAYELSPAEAAMSVISLVDDTFSLVEQHMPEANVVRLREIFHYQRPLWESGQG